MRISKISVCAALMVISFGFFNIASANHFTVAGSTNGNFSISGIVSFGEIGGGAVHTMTFFPGDQSDADVPSDDGIPVTIGYLTNGTESDYNCAITMSGSVINGVAIINSMAVNAGAPGTNYTYCRLLIATGLPWRLHTLTPGGYTSILENVGFQRAGTASCQRVAVGVSVGGGQASFTPINIGGCYLWTQMALSTTPLEIVSN